MKKESSERYGRYIKEKDNNHREKEVADGRR